MTTGLATLVRKRKVASESWWKGEGDPAFHRDLGVNHLVIGNMRKSDRTYGVR